MEKSPYFFHNDNEIFYPKRPQGKRGIWSNLFKPFKDTISKTNTCFRQHHDFLKENFPQRFRNKWLKHINHTTRQNSWSYVTIRELQARKQNHVFATNVFAKDKFKKRPTSHDFKVRYLSFLETKFCFKTPKPLKTTQKVIKFQKLSRKRWQVINFSPLSFQNSSKQKKKRSRTQAFQQILHLIFETNISFEHSN